MKPLKSLATLLIVYLSILTACSSTPEEVEMTEIGELMIFIEENYGDYKLLKVSFEADIYSPYPSFTQHIQSGIDTGYPYIFAYDLNQDGRNEYMFRVFKTKTANSERYDSVFEARTILVFGNVEGFKPTEKDFGYRGSVFNDEYNFIPNATYGIVPSGTYSRGYPFHDEITLSQTGLAGYSSYVVFVQEWIDSDSSRSYPIYLD